MYVKVTSSALGQSYDYSLPINNPTGPLFTKWTDVLPPNLAKSRWGKIECYHYCIALKSDRHRGSATDDVPVKCQSNWNSLNTNLAALRLMLRIFHEIYCVYSMWYAVDMLWDILRILHEIYFVYCMRHTVFVVWDILCILCGIYCVYCMRFAMYIVWDIFVCFIPTIVCHSHVFHYASHVVAYLTCIKSCVVNVNLRRDFFICKFDRK